MSANSALLFKDSFLRYRVTMSSQDLFFHRLPKFLDSIVWEYFGRTNGSET